jgi:hypothetical protein
MGQHLLLDHGDDLGAAAGLDLPVLGDQLDDLERDVLHQRVGRQVLREAGRQEQRKDQAAEYSVHGYSSFSRGGRPS